MDDAVWNPAVFPASRPAAEQRDGATVLRRGKSAGQSEYLASLASSDASKDLLSGFDPADLFLKHQANHCRHGMCCPPT